MEKPSEASVRVLATLRIFSPLVFGHSAFTECHFITFDPIILHSCQGYGLFCMHHSYLDLFHFLRTFMSRHKFSIHVMRTNQQGHTYHFYTFCITQFGSRPNFALNFVFTKRLRASYSLESYSCHSNVYSLIPP